MTDWHRKMDGMICSNCVHSDLMPMGVARTHQRIDWPCHLTHLNEPVRLCRRYPQQAGDGHWHEVGDNDWCGEWSARK